MTMSTKNTPGLAGGGRGELTIVKVRALLPAGFTFAGMHYAQGDVFDVPAYICREYAHPARPRRKLEEVAPAPAAAEASAPAEEPAGDPGGPPKRGPGRPRKVKDVDD